MAPGKRSKYWLNACGVVLSALSFVVVQYTASEEPFFVFHWPDLLLIGGLGGLVFVLLASWAVASVRYLRRPPRRGWFGTALVSACLLWTGMNLLYLGYSINAYRADLNDPRSRH